MIATFGRLRQEAVTNCIDRWDRQMADVNVVIEKGKKEHGKSMGEIEKARHYLGQ